MAPGPYIGRPGNVTSADKRGDLGGGADLSSRLEIRMLQGSFETLGFGEVLAMLSAKQQTGRLRLHSGSAVVDLYLSNGRLLHGETSAHGVPTRVASSVTGLEEACFEVLRWTHGSFDFHAGVVPNSPRNLDAEIDAVMAAARRRLEEWQTVQARVPSPDVTPKLVSDLGQEQVVIDRLAWRVLAAIDGRRDVNTLARVVGMSPYELSRILSDLVGDGLVVVAGVQPRVAMAPRPTRPGTTSVRLAPEHERVAPDAAGIDSAAGPGATNPSGAGDAGPGGASAGAANEARSVEPVAPVATPPA